MKYWIEAEGTGHYFFYAFPVCLILLFIIMRGRRIRFLLPSVIITVVIANPWFFQKWEEMELYAYWRILWIIPVIPVVAAVIPSITEKYNSILLDEKSTWKMISIKGITVITGIVAIIIGGSFVYNTTRGQFEISPGNKAKLPDHVVQIADKLLELDDHPRVVFQDPLGVYIRQYTGAIDTLFGRDMSGYIMYSPSAAAIEANTIINDPEGDCYRLEQIMLDEGYDYLVVAGEKNNEGLILIDQVCGYSIYKVEGLPSVIKKRNELGQVVSVTNIDKDGKPCNNDQGFATTTYRYNYYGDLIYEFHTDAEGNGVLDSTGKAGYEREVDSHGHIVMERYFGADGSAVKIYKGYAEIRWVYDGSNLVSFSFYDENGNPIKNKQGFFCVKRIYNKTGNVIEEKYYGTDETPIMMQYGYSEIRSEYNLGHKITEMYYDTEGKPVNGINGYHRILYTYDQEGHILSEEHYNTDGSLVN